MSTRILVALGALAALGALMTATASAAQSGRRRLVTLHKSYGSVGPPRVAMLPVVNKARVGGEGLAEQATTLLHARLMQRKDMVTLPLDEVQKAAGTVDLSGDLTNEQMTAIGRFANADLVARFIVSQAGVFESGARPYGALVIVGQALSADDGHTAIRVYARNATWKLGPNRTINAAEMLGAAVDEAALQFGAVSRMEGIVVSRTGGGFVRVSLGTDTANFRMRGEVAFYDGDEFLGYGDTVEVDDATALIKLRPPTDYNRIQLNCPVRAVYNPPPYAAGRTARQNERRIERKEDVMFTVAVATTLVIGYLTTRPPSGAGGALVPGVPPIPPVGGGIPPGAFPPLPPPPVP